MFHIYNIYIYTPVFEPQRFFIPLDFGENREIEDPLILNYHAAQNSKVRTAPGLEVVINQQSSIKS